jgi:ABC-type transport system involved in multi-copper enzyme maturation permease subunit
MMWLTWRQFRAQAIVATTGLALMVVLLTVTGMRLAHQFDLTGIPGCQAHGNCELLASNFMTTLRGSSYQAVFLFTTVLIYAVPALVGVFWGAPLITREIETGTLRLAWTQSVARTR